MSKLTGDKVYPEVSTIRLTPVVTKPNEPTRLKTSGDFAIEYQDVAYAQLRRKDASK